MSTGAADGHSLEGRWTCKGVSMDMEGAEREYAYIADFVTQNDGTVRGTSGGGEPASFMIRCDATPGEPRTVRFLQTARHGNWINTCVALLCDGRPEMRGAWFGGPTHARCAAFGAFAMERGGDGTAESVPPAPATTILADVVGEWAVSGWHDGVGGAQYSYTMHWAEPAVVTPGQEPGLVGHVPDGDGFTFDCAGRVAEDAFVFSQSRVGPEGYRNHCVARVDAALGTMCGVWIGTYGDAFAPGCWGRFFARKRAAAPAAAAVGTAGVVPAAAGGDAVARASHAIDALAECADAGAATGALDAIIAAVAAVPPGAAAGALEVHAREAARDWRRRHDSEWTREVALRFGRLLKVFKDGGSGGGGGGGGGAPR